MRLLSLVFGGCSVRAVRFVCLMRVLVFGGLPGLFGTQFRVGAVGVLALLLARPPRRIRSTVCGVFVLVSGRVGAVVLLG